MSVIPRDFRDKIEGSFYFYFFRGSSIISFGDVVYYIDKKVHFRPRMWERKMLLISDNALEQEKWLELAQEIYEGCSSREKRAFIFFRYALKKSQIDICLELNIEKSTFYSIREKLILAAALFAVSKKLYVGDLVCL